jgi:hypothetical protein
VIFDENRKPEELEWGERDNETEASVEIFDQKWKPEELELGEEWGRLEGLKWEPKETGGEANFKENRKPEELKTEAGRTRRWTG